MKFKENNSVNLYS